MHPSIHPSIVVVVVVDTLRHASSDTTLNMSDERTYIMIKYVHHVSDDDNNDEDDVFTRLSLSL